MMTKKANLRNINNNKNNAITTNLKTTEMLDNFCEFIMNVYKNKLLNTINLLKHAILILENKLRFANFVLENNCFEKVWGEISLKEIALQNGAYLQAKARPRLATIPAYLDKLGASSREEVTIKSMPLPEDIPFPFEKRLVIEYYWKV